LLLPKLLLELIQFTLVCAEFVEDPVIGTAQVNGEYQNTSQTKDNHNTAK
jgi:hypothetical protein